MQTLLVNKTDFSDIAIVNYDEGPLPDGQIRVDIGPFALTANNVCLLYTSPSPRDQRGSRMPSSA